MTDINTAQLAERAKNGDKTAVDEIYRLYSEPLKKFVIKQGLSEYDAQDIVSETFVEMLKHIDHLKEPSSFDSWIHTIAKRKAWEAKEKSSRRQDITVGTSENEDSADPDQVLELAYAQAREDTVMLPEDYAVNEDIKQIIAEQLDALSDDYKEALFLFYYKNKSISEIAELTGITPNNAKVRLFNARKKLKSNLEKLQKSGVVLCAVPFIRFIPLHAKRLETAAVAGSAAAKSAAEITAKSAARSAVKSTAAAAKHGIAVKAAAVVIGAAVIGGGVFALNRNGSRDGKENNSDKAPVLIKNDDDLVKEKGKTYTSQSVDSIAETVPVQMGADWKDVAVNKLAEQYGDAQGLKGCMYDIDGDEIPELFIYGKQRITAIDEPAVEGASYFSVFAFSGGYQPSFYGQALYTEPKLWCSGEPSPDNVMCLNVTEDKRTVRKLKSVGDSYLDNAYDDETAKNLFDFDKEQHIVIADENGGFEEINDFSEWLNRWDGNPSPVTEDAPLLSYGTLNTWQKSYFDYITMFRNDNTNIKCGLYDVNGDGVPEMFVDAEIIDDGTKTHTGSVSVLVACDSSGERDTLYSYSTTDSAGNEKTGGFTFTGHNENVCVLDDKTIEYTELRHMLVNGHFEYEGGISDKFKVTDTGFVFMRGKNEVDKEVFMESHTRLLDSTTFLSTCSASFDDHPDISWFDDRHRIDMFIKNETK